MTKILILLITTVLLNSCNSKASIDVTANDSYLMLSKPVISCL